MHLYQVLIFALDFCLQLVNHMRHNTELTAQLCNLVFRLHQVLAVKVFVCTHLLVQLLLLAQFLLAIC